MRLAVLGSGGIGGYYGALLAKGGHDVAFIARGAHLEALQQRGLTVRTPEGESTIPVTTVADTRSLAPVDLVLFCVKSYDTEPAAQALAPLMSRDTAVATFQNGLDNVEAIASVVGSGAVLVGAVYIAVQLAGPGVVLRTGGQGRIVFGEPSGAMTERVQRIAGAFEQSRIPREVSTDIHRVLWEKFLRRWRDGGRALGHWSAPREPREPPAPHHRMRGDRDHCAVGRGFASGRRRGSRHPAGRGVGRAVAIVDGPRPRRRPSARGRGTERRGRSAWPEARHPDTGPSDDRRLPVGSSAISTDDVTHTRALGHSGLSGRLPCDSQTK